MFKLPVGYQVKHPTKSVPKRRRQTGPFIRGPIPLAWLDPVLAMPGRTPLAVALALCYQFGLERSTRVRLTRKLRDRFSIESRSAGRALSLMESAGLVTVTRKPGRCLVVEILRWPAIR